MSKLVWRVKLVAERQPGVTTETELACIERDAQAGLADLGLSLAEVKQLTAALQSEIVPAQVAALGGRPRACLACGRRLASKGYSRVRFRSLFGDVPVRVRRLVACPCQAGKGEAKSVAVLDFGRGAAVAPELAYVTARYAALAPFGKVAALLSDLLPVSGTQHASTVRSRTLRVGTEIVQASTAEMATTPTPAATAGPVVVGLDGGYVRSRHRAEGRRFEVIAGKVITGDGAQHRLAFTRMGPAATTKVFRAALAAAGVDADTPATVLCDGDAGLWRLQREVLPNATLCANDDETNSLVQFRLWGLQENVSWSCRTKQKRRRLPRAPARTQAAGRRSCRRPRRLIPSCPPALSAARSPPRRSWASSSKPTRRPAPA